MSITVEELYKSRSLTMGTNASGTLKYVIRGTQDEGDARDALAAEAPSVMQGLVRCNMNVEPIHIEEDNAEVCRWEGTVEYTPGDWVRPETGDSFYQFEIGTTSRHVKLSLATVGAYGVKPKAGGAAATGDWGHMIGLIPGIEGEKGQIVGTDIDIPTYSWTERWYKDADEVDGAYKAAVFAVAANPINNDTFRAFSAGEVKFEGLSGGKRESEDDYELTFRFAASPNLTGISIADMSGIAVKGWEYLWTLEEETLRYGAHVPWPIAAYVEQIYGTSNFDALEIG